MTLPHDELAHKTVVGLVEEVSICGRAVLARIDTGAATSSIDLGLASDLQLGPLVAKRTVRSAHGKRIRPVLKALVQIKQRRIKASFTVVHRAHLEYPILIGRNILKKNFLIDPGLPYPQRKKP
jgi:hypothetical protein